MEDYYTIQTPGHHSTMFAELHTLQKQGVMCDVILAAEDGEVMAHKVVLMAASKYFRDKLSPVMGPTASKICLKGISVVELANLMKYIYTGKLLVAKETMDITLEISEILELNGVIQGYKEIISYEQMKGSKDNESAPKIKSAASGSSSVGKKPVESSSRLTTNVQLPKTENQASPGPAQTAVSNAPNVLSSSAVTQPTGANAVSSTSIIAQPDSNQGSKVIVTEQTEDGSTVTYQVDGPRETTEVSNSQYSSDYNFETLFDQQYMDVSAGSRTPSKTSGINSPQAVVTPPKLKPMSSLPTDSQKMAEERAQHQDLLAVAIETLSDVPHLKHSPHVTQPEVDRAISSISSSETVAVVPHNIFKAEECSNLEDFENGKTDTKTVTMSAGSVSNELGGKTDVYTVALDPASIKSPLKMARPKRSKSAKEKEAEEKAKMYRQKKAQILQAVTTSDLPVIQDTNYGRGKRQRVATSNQDFQYESLSKAKKKPFVPRILLASKNVTGQGIHDNKVRKSINESELQSIFVGTTLGTKNAMEEKQHFGADDFGQVVNFDSDDNVEDDVDGMIADNLIAALNSDKSINEEKKSGKESVTESETYETNNSKGEILNDTSKNPSGAQEVANENEKGNNSPLGTNIHKELSENEDRESIDDLQLQHLDEATDEKIRSSSTKRKTRTPRKLPLSDEEKGNDSGSERRENISVDMKRRSSRSLNLDKEKETEIDKSCSKPAEDSGDNSEQTKNKNRIATVLGGLSKDFKEKNVSKPSEIKIIAHSKVDEIDLDEVERLVHDSDAKKIIIVPKNFQPEVRLKKQTTEEMLQMAKDIASSQRKTSSDEKNVAIEDNEDGVEMNVDKNNLHSPMDAESILKDSGKRKNEKSGNVSVVKRRKIVGKMVSRKESLPDSVQETGKDFSVLKSPGKANKIDFMTNKGNHPGISVSYSARVESLNRNVKSSLGSQENNIEAREKQETGKVETRRKKENEKVFSTECETDTGELHKQGNSMAQVCPEHNCLFSSTSVSSLKRHQAMFHDKRASETLGKGEKAKKLKKASNKTEDKLPDTPNQTIVKKEVPDVLEDEVNSDGQTKSIGAGDSDVQPECFYCGKIFKNKKILKKHVNYSHSDRKKLICEQCDFTTPFESSMSTHIMLKHTLDKPMLSCKYCSYETPLTGNLRKHIFGTHGLFIVTKQHRKMPLYAKYEEGTILTKDGHLFDPETMRLPKLPKRSGVKEENLDKTGGDKDSKKTTRIALSKLPVEEFVQEMMKRHEKYLTLPEKNFSFMSSSIAQATEHPSFPQASPQVRNTRANKIYNMKKLKQTFQDQVEQSPATYGLGNLHGMDQGQVSGGLGGIPQVASEVEVTHDYPPEVVLENVEADASPPTTVLTISEQRSDDGSEMIIINQAGKQTVVRSKDFYDTLAATGHDASQTLGVISALLQAGEQIEIREQEEQLVEIQNM